MKLCIFQFCNNNQNLVKTNGRIQSTETWECFNFETVVKDHFLFCCKFTIYEKQVVLHSTRSTHKVSLAQTLKLCDPPPAVPSIYLGVDCLAHGNAGTLQCILLDTEVTTLWKGEGTQTTCIFNSKKIIISITGSKMYCSDIFVEEWKIWKTLACCLDLFPVQAKSLWWCSRLLIWKHHHIGCRICSNTLVYVQIPEKILTTT